jgi:hypothetical protein
LCNVIFSCSKKVYRLWFSFADLLEFRASAGSQVPDRSLVWVFKFVKGNQMKYSVLLAALLAASMTACGQKEEAAAPAEAPAAEAPAAEAPAPMEAAPAEAPAADAAAPAADAAAPAADAAAPAPAPAQ